MNKIKVKKGGKYPLFLRLFYQENVFLRQENVFLRQKNVFLRQDKKRGTRIK